MTVTADIRFPATHKKEEILELLEKNGIAYEVVNYQAPLYNNPKGELIQTLMGVYNEATGENAAPIAIGGGTYARALKCGVAFGPEMKDEEATIHQANEYVTFDRIRLMSEIYYKAIKAVSMPKEESKILCAYPTGEGYTKIAQIHLTSEDVPKKEGAKLLTLKLKIEKI